MREDAALALGGVQCTSGEEGQVPRPSVATTSTLIGGGSASEAELPGRGSQEERKKGA